MAAGSARTGPGWWPTALVIVLLAVAATWLTNPPVLHLADQDVTSVQKRVDDVLEDATYEGKTRTGIDQYEKAGGEDAADADFDYLAGDRKVKRRAGRRWVRFEDGTTIVRYPSSEKGEPSIDIQKSPNIPRTKIRYR